MPPAQSPSVRLASIGFRHTEQHQAFLDALAVDGGIVEERLVGSSFASPGAQLHVSPNGEIEVLTTHDQVLGGPSGQTDLGCRFPAAPAYAPLISRHAEAVAAELAERGVVGRFGIDFVVTRARDGWLAHAIEINLRSGSPAPSVGRVVRRRGDRRSAALDAGQGRNEGSELEAIGLAGRGP